MPRPNVFDWLLFAPLAVLCAAGALKLAGLLPARAADPGCPVEYDRALYPYDAKHQRGLLPKYRPYADINPGARAGLDVEHIVALRTAHYAGLCHATAERRSQFAKDTLNQTLASGAVNGSKGSKRFHEWRPGLYQGDGTTGANLRWMAHRVTLVYRKYGLRVPEAERRALREALRGER